jgi:outer membrane immunogenic protein
MRKTIVAALVAFSGIGGAQASDLSMKDEIISPTPAARVWSGPYIGGSIGFGVGRSEGGLIDDDDDGFAIEYNANGAIYGGHAGYNFQRGHMVFGIEAAGNYDRMIGSEDSFLRFESELDWSATLVARLGYASGNTLFYAFGGGAWADLTFEVASGFLGGGVGLEATDTVAGWTAGLGIEHALNDRLSVRVEYSHVDLGNGSFFDSTAEMDMKFDAFKIGVSYRFSR